MDEKSEKNQLFGNLAKLRNDIVLLKKDLNKINDEKESWFEKRKSISNEIKEQITKIKEQKSKRDALTGKVRELKQKRTAFTAQTKEMISEFRRLADIKKSLYSKSKIMNHSALKEEIEGLESKLETEVMSFEKEKELSKKIKLLKKGLREASEIKDAANQVGKLNRKIKDDKASADKLHRDIQKIADESQRIHESVLEISKGIDGLKASEKEAQNNFAALKKDFSGANIKLKEKLLEMSGIKQKLNQFRLEETEKRKLRENAIIKNKEQEIENKIKGRKKLTTEDFLVFQT